jgi:hypothetical protein
MRPKTQWEDYTWSLSDCGSLLCFLIIVSGSAGCTTLTPSASTRSTPVFMPTQEDTPRLSRLAHELDTKALQCVEAANCEQVSYARGLVSLFENQEAAHASFLHVIEHSPGSPLAITSQRWLRFLGDHEACPSTDIVAELVRNWIERQLTSDQPAALIATEDTLVEQTRVVHGVVQVLDKVLRSQLEALKLIDQESSHKQRKFRPPASLVPTAAIHE